MIYISLIALVLLIYKLIRIIVNEIKQHITKESNRIIETLKNEYYENRNIECNH